MKDKSTKPAGKSKYAQRRSMPYEATHHLHRPKVYCCTLCNPAYQAPVERLNEPPIYGMNTAIDE